MRAGSTIYALSTPPGRSAVAVVRLSGPTCAAILTTLCGRLPPPREARLRCLRDAAGAVIDAALTLWLPGPASFTGEDMAELHLHGGAAVIAATLEALSGLGASAAAPGDFTRRAFANGRLDLAQVEGLADLLEAETCAQAQLALRQLGGALGRQAEAWRAVLVAALARLEAELDFSDEGDVPGGAMLAIRADIGALAERIGAASAGARSGEIAQRGLAVVLAGPPNAGKSSLLNALAARDVAIVSPEPGTTRDVIEVALDLGGHRVTIADTAGLRADAGDVEALGIARTHARLATADVVLWLQPADGAPAGPPPAPPDAALIVIASKADRGGGGTGLPVSAHTGAGLAELLARLSALAAERMPRAGDVLVTRARQRDALQDAELALRNCLAGDPAAAELRAEDLRRAAFALGRLVGRIDVEDVLGDIFGRFCIGK